VDPATRQRLTSILDRAESNLKDSLLPFWGNSTWDDEHGGFLTRLDRKGKRIDTSEKLLIMQARMISSLASAHRHGITERGYLDLAARGFDFLLRKMWDAKDAGFFFSVARDGTPNTTRKNTDSHAYAIIALTDFHMASGRNDALRWAQKTFDILQERAADRELGFIEDFDGGEWPVHNDDQMNLGGRKDIKTIDTHVNLLESFCYLLRSSKAPEHRQALKGLLDLLVLKGIHHEYGCTITSVDRDWNPLPDANGKMTTCYGLNVEASWLMLAAADLLRESRDKYRDVILGLVDHALDYGFDHERGGLASYGPLSGKVTDAADLNDSRLLKPWWGQAEMLNALLDVYRWTGSPNYLSAFEKLFDWIWAYQIDHRYGGWYQEVRWDTGEPVTTDKGREWKAAFHASRALIRTSDALRQILRAA